LFHGIADRGQEVCCGQNDCPRKFTSFYALKCHLSKHHSNLIEAAVVRFQFAHSATVSSIASDSLLPDDGDDCSIDSDGHMQETDRLMQDIKMIMLSLVCSLSSKPSMTMTNVLSVIESVTDMLFFIKPVLQILI
jgi:hypothetical protein